MLGGYWKRRATEAETTNTQLREQLEALKECLTGMELRFKDRAALISIVRQDRLIRFTFIRFGQLHVIEVIGTWSDDIESWKRDLLEKVKTDG